MAAANAVQMLGNYRAEIKHVGKVAENTYSYDVSVFRDGHDVNEWLAFCQEVQQPGLVDAAGASLRFNGGSSSNGPTELSYKYTFIAPQRGGVKTGEPDKLVWTYPVKIE